MAWSVVWTSRDTALATALQAPHLPRPCEQVHTQLLRRIFSDVIVPAADQMHGTYTQHVRTVTPWFQHISASLDTMRRHAHLPPCEDTNALLPALLRANHAVHTPSHFPMAWPSSQARSPSLVSDDLPMLSSDATFILSPHHSVCEHDSPSSNDLPTTPGASPR
ncbi:hypothetical protein MEQU1_001310 [Malassezia equina]|uniref:Uncharacterized protein n=1 Tax=Malassezia equina TaxID=1381935 RepID=A0AAF0EH63_9BASI|nr:hypothetical protein MEQU1_001310 [Malassezia equina]